MILKPGDVLHVNQDASVQFGGDRALIFRIIRVSDQPTYHGWIWLTGYVLDKAGKALARREIYVLEAGLQRATPPQAAIPQTNRPAARTASRTR